jgi:hypothetical protein
MGMSLTFAASDKDTEVAHARPSKQSKQPYCPAAATLCVLVPGF